MPLLTMLFTDVVGSSATKRDVAFGRDSRERDVAYLARVQTRHFDLVRQSCRAHSGREVSNMGDAFFLVFEEPLKAVRCAVDIQQKLAANPIDTPSGPLRLRIGLHSGFPEFFEGSWHGTDVDAAARVEAAASAQQILLSSRTYELVRQMTDVRFHPKGQFALKGVDSTALWEVDWDGKGPRRTSVPSLDTAISRKRTLRAMALLISCIALVGVAGYMYSRYHGGQPIWPSRPRPSVAVMGFKNVGKPDADWLSGALTEMLSTNLGETDAVRTISPDDVSTARVDLGVAFLPLMNSETLNRLRRILHSQYVVSGTFLAMGTQPSDTIRIDVHLQDAETGEILSPFYEEGTIATLSSTLEKAGAAIRDRLGVQQSPLASSRGKPILPSNPEALRMYSQGLAELRAFDLLAAKDSLESSIALEPHLALPHLALARAWKLLGYDQKAGDEAKLAVDLSADLQPSDRTTIEAYYFTLTHDWDKAIKDYGALSLLYRDEPNYALELARTQTDAGQARDALATLSELSHRKGMPDDPRVDYARALAEQSLSEPAKQRDAALAAVSKATPLGARLLAAHAYWQLCGAYYALGEFNKGEAACDQSNRAAPADDLIKARSQTDLANIYKEQGRINEAIHMHENALDTARKIGSQKDVAGALQNLANLVDLQGNEKQARSYYEEAIDISRKIDDKFGLAGVQNDYAAHLYQQGDFDRAAALYSDTIGIARAADDKGDMAFALENLGLLQSQQGELAQAQQNIEQAIALQQQAGAAFDRINSLPLLADVLFARGDLAGARSKLEEALSSASAQGMSSVVASAKIGLANIALAEGNLAGAQTLANEAASIFSELKDVDSRAGACNILARSYLDQDNLVSARQQVDQAFRISPRDRPTVLSLQVTRARLLAREGKPSEAQRDLNDSLRQAQKGKLTGNALEIRIAQTELLASTNPPAAQQQLKSLENEARRLGYLQFAAEAERRLKSMSAHRS